MEPSQEQSLEEKMALMEKSYELAARYNGKQTPSVIPTDDRKDRTSVKPVKRIRQEVVSSLAQPVNDGDFIAGVSEERNTGFHTPVGRTPVSDRNTLGYSSVFHHQQPKQSLKQQPKEPNQAMT
jgi:hypothetical protein